LTPRKKPDTLVTPNAPTATQRHALILYNRLKSEAKIEQGDLLVWRGALTTTYTDLGISQQYYQRVVKCLEFNEVIEWAQKGKRGIESVIVLHPLPELPLSLPEKKPAKALTDDPIFAKLVDKVEALEEMIGGLDIAEVLVNYEERLRALEASNGSEA
jgi:hypothetical protein